METKEKEESHNSLAGINPKDRRLHTRWGIDH
jgi:hypothetical protein